MRIHSLTIDNVRAIEHLALRDLPASGVVVIHGDNEQGKSTILDALDAVLNLKHTSSSKNAKSLQPVNRDVPPEVRAHLTIGPVELMITKRWVKSKSAELEIVSPEPGNYTGGEAEDKFEEILKTYLDDHLMNALFLRQNDLGEAVKAAGIPSLEQALGASTEGDASGTGEDDALMAAVEREYARFYTGTEKENKEFSTARTRRKQAATALARAEEKVNELAVHVDAVEREEIAKASDEKSLPGALTAREEANAALVAAQQIEITAASAHESLDRARAELDAARRAVTEREELSQEVTEAQQAAAGWAITLAEAKEKAAEERAKATALSAALDAAKQARAEASELAKTARRTAALVADATALSELRGLVEKLDELDDTIAATRTRLAGFTVTDADIEAVSTVASALDVARGIQAMSIARLEFTASTTTDIEVDGHAIAVDADSVQVDLVDGVQLTIGEVTATYHAGHTSGVDPAEDVRRYEQALAELLDEQGCATLAELRGLREDATATQATLLSLIHRRTDLLGERDGDEIRARAAHLAERFADADVPDLSSSDAQAAVSVAEQRLDDADAAVRAAEAALEPWKEGEAVRALAQVTAHHDNAQARATEFASKLYVRQDRATDEDLAVALESAAVKFSEATAAADNADAARIEADPEGKLAQANAANARVASLEKRIRATEVELARLSGFIERAAGAAEDLEKARAEDEVQERTLAALERHAHAIARLRTVLRSHRDRAREKYRQPFVDELTKLARTVFGSQVVFGLDDDLSVAKRTLDGQTIALAALSGGAKEQLALLTRFAIASLVSRGSGEFGTVPVIVDDALGSTDPRRLQLMSQLFVQVGRQAQVIVLTCFPQRYDGVHPKIDYQITQLKQR